MKKSEFLERVLDNDHYVYLIDNDDLKSHDIIKIKCEKHNSIFEQKVYIHLSGSTGCRECYMDKIKSKNKLGINEFIKRCNLKHKNYYDYSKVTFVDTKTKVTIICPEHGEFYPTPSNHMNGSKCPNCAHRIKIENQKITFDEFVKKSNKMFNNRYIYFDNGNFDYKRLIKCECSTHGVFNLNPERHLTRLSECPKCIEDRNKVSIDEFIIKSNIIFNNKYNYSLVNFKTLKDKVGIICPKHGTYYQYATHHLHNKKGCKHCSKENVVNKYLLNFIKECNIIHNNKYNYSLVKIKSLKEKVEIICPIHGSFFKRPNEHLNKKSGCQSCVSSKGEKLIRQFLIKNKIQYNEQKKFNECKNIRELPFDFYLPKLNICIEYDGAQHFNPIDKWGGEDRFNDIKNNDNIKNEFCLNNKIKLLRISYKDYDKIDNILTEKIIKLKNESKIDILSNKLDVVNDYLFKYKFDNYVNVNSHIDIICPFHGLSVNTAYQALQGNGCSSCSESKSVAKYLDKNNISYYRQHKFSDCKNVFQLPFDFYLPKYRTAIEFDGKQHYEPMEFFGGLDAYNRLKVNDKIKSDYCEDNYIDLIRIRYDQIDRVFEILKESLKNKI
jgi:very-short-patch-repair endonuclease